MKSSLRCQGAQGLRAEGPQEARGGEVDVLRAKGLRTEALSPQLLYRLAPRFLTHSAPRLLLLLLLLNTDCAGGKGSPGRGEPEGAEAGANRGEERGRCYMEIPTCLALGNRVAREEEEEAYHIFKVGHNASACLARGRDHWEKCGNTLFMPVIMFFWDEVSETEIRRAFPSEKTQIAAVHYANKPLELQFGKAVDLPQQPEPLNYVLNNMEEYDEDLQDFFRDPEDYSFEQNFEEVQPGQEHPYGWKVVHVFVGRHKHTGDDIMQLWNSQYGQDALAMRLLQHKRNGFFVDIGAHEAISSSNTVSMERHWGWNGLCVEPLVEMQWGLTHRRCKLVNAVIGSTTDELVTFAQSGWCGVACAGIQETSPAKNDAQTVTLPTISFSKLLADHNVPSRIDFLSVDVEGAEEKVFSSFPFDTYTVMVMTVETQNFGLIDRLRSHGYIMVKNLFKNDIVLVHKTIAHFDWIQREFNLAD